MRGRLVQARTLVKETKKRILMFGYLPPPYFGPSVVYQTLLRSGFARHYDVTFVNQRFSRHIAELQRFHLRKVLETGRLLLVELWHLLTQRFDLCCISISVNRKAFWKESVFLRLAGWFGVRAVLHAHAYGFVDFYQQSPPRLQRLIDRVVSHAAAAIVMGERVRDEFSRWLPPEKIFVVAPGIEPAGGVAEPATPDHPFTVLFLGNLLREKGVFVLLEAVPQILAAVPAAEFILAGAWPNEPDHRLADRWLADSGIAKQVHFAGVVWGETKQAVLARADVVALPTHYPLEVHPIVLLEALEAGLPVVTTARGAIPEIITDETNGLLVREQDPGDLADKIIRLARDPALRDRMRRANREKFQHFYTHEHFGQRMIAVFAQLCVRR
jgi:glycosyltransferase involved in cell wall biosynthesis